MVYFENPSYKDAIIGISTDRRVVYSYEKMVEQFMKEEQCSVEEAVDFIDYNTIRSLDYVKDAPIVVYEEYDIDYFEE